MELTVLGCSGSYGAPGGRRVQRLPRARRRRRRSGSTAATARSRNLQQHIGSRATSPRSCSPTAPRPLRRHLRPARAATLRPRARRPAGVRARGRREVRSQALVGDWGDTFDWRVVGDGDTRHDRRRRRCGSRAPTTRRPRSAVEVDARRQAARLHRRHRPGLERRRVRPGADLVLSEATYLHDDIRAPIHLSAQQAGAAAREARRAAADAHPPLADARPGSLASRRARRRSARAVTLAAPHLVTTI